MALEAAQLLARGHIPQAGGRVPGRVTNTARKGPFAVRGEGHRDNGVRVSGEASDFNKVPPPDCPGQAPGPGTHFGILGTGCGLPEWQPGGDSNGFQLLARGLAPGKSIVAELSDETDNSPGSLL